MSGELVAAGAVTVVTAAMAWSVGQQWRGRRRPYQAAWLVALAMAAVAALSYVLFLLAGRPLVLFRLYYLFGAALNVAFLGLGSLFLAVRRDLRPLVLALIVLSIVTASAIFAAPADPAALASATGAGTNVFGLGPWLPLLIVMNVFGTVCLVGVALWSAWNTWRSRQRQERAVANVVIAAGALTIAGAGTAARLAGAGAFWVIMLAGWLVLYVGFTLTQGNKGWLLARRALGRSAMPGVEQSGTGRT